jgi:hypothetical protein
LTDDLGADEGFAKEERRGSVTLHGSHGKHASIGNGLGMVRQMFLSTLELFSRLCLATARLSRTTGQSTFSLPDLPAVPKTPKIPEAISMTALHMMRLLESL